MDDYNLVRTRVDLYVQATGFSRKDVNEFRRTPISDWVHPSDRRVARAIRGLEKLWRDPEVTVKLWLRTARGVLKAIADFFDEVITTVEELGARIALAIDQALLWVERTAERVEKFARRYPRLVKALKFIGSAALLIYGRRNAPQLPARA
jgi:hypothetical protein